MPPKRRFNSGATGTAMTAQQYKLDHPGFLPEVTITGHKPLDIDLELLVSNLYNEDLEKAVEVFPEYAKLYYIPKEKTWKDYALTAINPYQGPLVAGVDYVSDGIVNSNWAPDWLKKSAARGDLHIITAMAGMGNPFNDGMPPKTGHATSRSVLNKDRDVDYAKIIHGVRKTPKKSTSVEPIDLEFFHIRRNPGESEAAFNARRLKHAKHQIKFAQKHTDFDFGPIDKTTDYIKLHKLFITQFNDYLFHSWGNPPSSSDPNMSSIELGESWRNKK